MKTRNPKTRFDINPTKGSKILEVGGGHDPHPLSQLVVDKYLDSNYHRSGNIKVLQHQKFMQADGEALPFADKSFDFVICNHVLEHVDNPVKFMQEQARVAKEGYLETPSFIGEYLVPKESHRWLILEIDNKVVMVEKERVGFKPSHDLGNLFLDYFPKQSIGYKMMQRTHGDFMTVRYQWKDGVDLIVNPDSEEYLKYFTKPWEAEHYQHIMPQRDLGREAIEALFALVDITKSVFKSKFLTA